MAVCGASGFVAHPPMNIANATNAWTGHFIYATYSAARRQHLPCSTHSSSGLTRLLLFGRFFAQRAGGFVFAGRGGGEIHAARGRFALTLADVIKEPLQVVTSLARQVVARLADFSQDSIHGSTFQQIKRSANRGTGPARPCAEAFNLPADGNVMDMRAIPSQQNI